MPARSYVFVEFSCHYINFIQLLIVWSLFLHVFTVLIGADQNVGHRDSNENLGVSSHKVGECIAIS